MKKFKVDFLDSDKCIAFTKFTKWETIEDCRTIGEYTYYIDDSTGEQIIEVYPTHDF